MADLTRTDLVLVGIGQARWSARSGEVLFTRSIGSSCALALHDPIRGVAGVLHWLLPDSAIDPARAIAAPALFADTGIPHLIRGMEGSGAERKNLCAVLAGASSMREGGAVDVGGRNREAAYRILRGAGLVLRADETGGVSVRDLSLEVGFGNVSVCTRTH